MVHLLHRLYGVDAPDTGSRTATYTQQLYLSCTLQDNSASYPTRDETYIENTSTKYRYIVSHRRAHDYTGWRRGVVDSGVRRMNEVNARRARLLLGWVTVFGRVYRHGI